MSPTLPPEIRVESSRHGTRYLLPPRETGPLKLVAGFFIGFGCLFCGFALIGVLGALGITQKAGFQIGGVLVVLFGLPFLLVGLGTAALGVFAWCGRTEIEIQPGELITRERGGPFRWTRRIPIKDIRRFALGKSAVNVNDRPVQVGPMSTMGLLAAELGEGKSRMVLLGYPRDWVGALATRLTADLVAQTGQAPLAIHDGSEEKVFYRPQMNLEPGEVPGPPERLVIHGDRFDPPARTAIRIMEQAGGLVAVVPPSGFRGVSRFLLFFSLFWLFISTIVGGGFIAAAIQGKGERPPWFLFPFIGGFILIGLGMLVTSVNLARRKASIRASRAEFIVLQQSLFGTKAFNLSGSDLDTIRVGDSGMEINEVPVQEIQVHTKAGVKHSFFSNLTDDELHWLATHLRHATGAGEAPGGNHEPPKLTA
ncbi:MAG: hypothetical protein B9S33_11800 [Pedosphaera sp. Tous-C6FEB]|nr:MAG: hypothetical protein B9S33_11800 [Pedosphaera sp. Tous-C6FEB]